MSSTDQDALQLFSKVSIFQGLSWPQLSSLLYVAKARTSDPGELIIQEGGEGDSLFILANGSVEITKTMTLVAKQDLTNVEKTLVRLDGSEPVCFGEMGMLERAERSATVTATSPCRLYEIARADFERLVMDDPRLGCVVVGHVARMVCGRLRQANKDILKLATALSISLGNR